MADLDDWQPPYVAGPRTPYGLVASMHGFIWAVELQRDPEAEVAGGTLGLILGCVLFPVWVYLLSALGLPISVLLFCAAAASAAVGGLGRGLGWLFAGRQAHVEVALEGGTVSVRRRGVELARAQLSAVGVDADQATLRVGSHELRLFSVQRAELEWLKGELARVTPEGGEAADVPVALRQLKERE